MPVTPEPPAQRVYMELTFTVRAVRGVSAVPVEQANVGMLQRLLAEPAREACWRALRMQRGPGPVQVTVSVRDA